MFNAIELIRDFGMADDDCRREHLPGILDCHDRHQIFRIRPDERLRTVPIREPE
jgi:hypothetical protein